MLNMTSEETELRIIWAEQGVSLARQDEMILQISAKAAPGAKVANFILGGGAAVPENYVEPTDSQKHAVLLFKARFNNKLCQKKGFTNWIEVLEEAWFEGWDASCEEGHLLRQLRNNFGQIWLNMQKP